MKILFLSFTREDIGVAMVTNMISQLQELPARACCVLCGNFISIYKINRTLHGRAAIGILSSHAKRTYFQPSKIKFVSPRGHVISSIYSFSVLFELY